MGEILIVVLCVIVLATLIVSGTPIAVAMIFVGIGGQVLLLGYPQAMSQLVFVVSERGMDFLLTAIPLFILMGQLVHRTGLGARMFDAAYNLTGAVPGGVSVATIVSSALFGSVTGSSIATVSSIGSLSLPEMRKYKYNLAYSSATIAASGTLSVLIPPSLFLIIYSSISGVSIAQLFVASLIPALILTTLFVGVAISICRVDKSIGPPAPSRSAGRKFMKSLQLAPILIVFLIIIGGMALGYFTATEAAAVGVVAVLLVAALFGSVRVSSVLEALKESTLMCASLFLIIVGGSMMNKLFSQTGFAEAVTHLLTGSYLPGWAFLLLIIGFYIMLGAVLDALSMLVLLTPILLPVALGFGYDPLWFGVFVIVLAELAMITPPVGINVYVIGALTPEESTGRIFRFSTPYSAIIVLFVFLISMFPQIVLWLPGLLF